MSAFPYVLLEEVTKDNQLVVYSGNTKKEYRLTTTEDKAKYYREALKELKEDEAIYFEFDEKSEKIQSI